jgi:hypothetical protein
VGNIFLALFNTVKAKILPIWTKLKLWTTPSFIKAKLLTRIRVFFSSLLNIRPRDEKDYYGFFGWLISKRLVVALTIVIGLVSIYYIVFVNPPSIFLQSGTGIKTYDYNSIPLRFTEGEVRILGKSKYLAYEGEVKKGNASGLGTLYAKAGNVVYEGNFENSMYNGKGNLYYPSGQLHYIGEFVDNEFQGTGTLYRENGSLEYIGTFVDNMKEGNGELFDSSNNQIYEGAFSKDHLVYSSFLDKTTAEAANMYTGARTAYSDVTDFVVDMPDINAMYHGKRNTNNVDGTIKIDSVYVFDKNFYFAGKKYNSVYDLKNMLGEIEYEGNTYVTMADATAIHIMNENDNPFFETIEGKWVNTFDDAVTVQSYDLGYIFYLYTFVKDDISYNFYCKDRTGEFAMYSMEKQE